MIVFVAWRALAAAFTLLGISIVTWGLMSLAPGDAAQIYARQFAASGFPTPEEVARARVELGLDGGVVSQFLHWAATALTGNLGRSFQSGERVAVELGGRLPATLELTVAAMIVIVTVGIGFGTLAALGPNRAPDLLLRGTTLVAAAVPSFWLSLVLIWIFAATLGWLPSTGRQGWDSLVLPALALALPGCAVVIRLVRGSMLDSLTEEYVTAARARGVSEAGVVVRHALRNALVPVVTHLGLAFGTLLSGAAIVETIFAWPGVGKLAVDAIAAQDYPVLQGFVLFSAVIYLVVNLGVDVAYRVLDPRVARETASIGGAAR